MANSTVEENLLNIRWDIRASELLNKAATYSHVSISEFVLSPRDNLRRESCTGERKCYVTTRGFSWLLAVLDVQTQPTPALKKAFTRH
ncbi:DUF1778 domain-containing protein [Methylicorpusculum sp.]|uniref:type II toxin -antitoxin system TacA 1-like antitoxin n=1 Tax=Methylicorpusculum sp. TaxID=2713644 RepID=UPI00351E0F3D